MLRVTMPTGQSPAMRDIDEQISRFAAFDIGVLLTGEPGVGKRRLARLIHERSPRSDGPFVTIDCATMSDSAFDRRGSADAHGGTVLVRDIDRMNARQQESLYRFLDAVHDCDRMHLNRRARWPSLRVVAAATSRLLEAVECGRFRQDLFYRLNTVHISVPPLRERSEDVPVLLDQFVREIADLRRCAPPPITPQTLRKLVSYHWPENVRELKLVARRLVMRSCPPRSESAMLAV